MLTIFHTRTSLTINWYRFGSLTPLRFGHFDPVVWDWLIGERNRTTCFTLWNAPSTFKFFNSNLTYTALVACRKILFTTDECQRTSATLNFDTKDCMMFRTYSQPLKKLSKRKRLWSTYPSTGLAMISQNENHEKEGANMQLKRKERRGYHRKHWTANLYFLIYSAIEAVMKYFFTTRII